MQNPPQLPLPCPFATNATRHRPLTAALVLLSLALVGCPGLSLDKLADTASIDQYERSCWDVNDNGVGELEEDVNGDGAFDELDCIASADGRGAPGPQGPAGADGLSCWDTDGDGEADAEEDVNRDGDFNALDCVGAQGPAGPSAGPYTYGNGSAGPKLVSVSTTLADTNLQYTDFTVNTGVTLTVPSGAVIRCTGTFTNNGTIVVQTSARGGTEAATAPTVDTAFTPAHPGVAISMPAGGEYGSNAATRAGGPGGVAVSAFAARWILAPGANAGGGGAGAIGTAGGVGGGSLVILAQSGVLNYGTISANGATGALRSGGGGGGIVILASSGVTANAGTINANGGNGGANDANGGAGGGGGGGIVHLIGPNTVVGTVNVFGGTNGAVGVGVTADPRQGGGGGGACGGNGGTGGNVSAAGAAGAATAGAVGQSLQTDIDPVWLF